MTKQVQIRRGTDSQHTSFTGAEGEISVNTTNDSVHVHDGTTAGGKEMARADGSNVAFTGGTIDGAVIGGTTPAAGTFTTLTASGDVNFDSNTLFVDASANAVGIGTNVPDTPLEISTTGSGATNVLKLTTTGEGTVPSIVFEGDQGGTQHTAARIRAGQEDASNGNIIFEVEDAGSLDEAVRIMSSGNIGFSTSSPHDSGVNFTVLNVNGTKGGSLAFSRGTNSATKQWAIRTSDDEDLRFEYGSTLASEAMRIDGSNGNVGVGQPSPSTTLSVRGGSANGIELDEDLDNSTDSNRLFFTTSAGSNSIRSQSGNLRFSTGATAGSSSGTTRMTLDTSGNLLVGKESSDYTTTGSEINDGGMIIVNSSTSTNLGTNGGANILLVNSSATDGNFSNIGSYNSNQLVDSQINFIHESHSSRTGAIGFSTHDGSALTEHMRIESDGDIQFAISTNAMGLFSDSIGEVGSGNFALQVSNTAQSALKPFGIRAEDIRFATGSSERLRIDSAGALQIGGTSNAGFIDFDSTSLQLNTQRNPNTGAFSNTGKSHASIIMNGASGGSDIKFYTASANNTTATERLRIQSGGGISFNGDTAQANALDDYEQGTWSPTIFKTSEVTGLYTIGNYTRIGRTIHLAWYVYKASVTTSGSDSWKVGNLPYSGDYLDLANGSYQFIPAGYLTINGTAHNTTMSRWQANATNQLQLYSGVSTNNCSNAAIEFSGTGTLILS